MKKHPLVRELQPLARPAIRRNNAVTALWDRFATAVTNSEFVTVAIFSAIGFLITLNAMIYFPNLGAIVEQYNILP